MTAPSLSPLTAAAPFAQASFLTKKLSLGGRRVTLAIWDTAGQERFHALGPIYYRDSNGACLIYDVTDEDSFQKVGPRAGMGLCSRQGGDMGGGV